MRLRTVVRTSCLAASFGTLLCACGSPPALDAEVAELCRAHAGDALVFQWPEGREVLPVDDGVTSEEDRALRARFALPARSPGPSRFNYPISAAEPFGDGWLIGIDGGEWGGALFFVREGEPPRELQRGNVVALVGSKSGVYAFFRSVARMDEGHYRFISAPNGWIEVGEPTELPGAPLAIARKGDVLFMAGYPKRAGRSGWARVFHPGRNIEVATVSPCR